MNKKPQKKYVQLAKIPAYQFESDINTAISKLTEIRDANLEMDSIRLDIEVLASYDNDETFVIISGYRRETKKEVEQRLEKDKKFIEQKEENEKKTLEKLKAKYENT